MYGGSDLYSYTREEDNMLYNDTVANSKNEKTFMYRKKKVFRHRKTVNLKTRKITNVHPRRSRPTSASEKENECANIDGI